MMNSIQGYSVERSLFSRGLYTFYAGTSKADGRAVFLKVLERVDIYSPAIAALRREYDITRSLHHPSIPKALDFVEFHGGAALVQEYDNALELKQRIGNEKSDVQAFLQIAINISEGLAYLHSKDVIHKDLKPSNILVNSHDLSIKIVDFGIAALIPQEDLEPVSNTVLQGSLSYISPEQTGRMNRPLDYRTDFYSLGVTFYEMLSGRLPFNSVDPMELVHAHLAVKPIPLNELNRDAPTAVSGIVMKLLEKSPENRYRSALGLKADLHKCYELLQNTGVISDFELGTQDFSEKLNIAQRLYGREAELETLMGAFQKALSGNSQIVLVSGLPGIGKSALVNEIQRPVVEQKGLYFRGKFDQYQRNIPYSALLEAFNEFVDYLLTGNEAELHNWKERIISEVGENAGLLLDIVPALEPVIGKQHAVAELPAAEAFNRFSIIMQRFVKAISSGAGPFVLFLDDLQWADAATLQLLDSIINDSDRKRLLIIGAYRDTEIVPGHPLNDLIKQEETLENLYSIHLGPLQTADLTNLLADTFSGNTHDVEELSELISRKTNSIPFFVSEFIKNLYKKRLVHFDASRAQWQWSIAQIEQSNIADNVIELVTENLKSLDEEALRVCSLAACVGNQFDLETLSLVDESNSEDTAAKLWPAIKEGIIVPLTDNYRTISNQSTNGSRVFYKFLHDRIQQAAYSLIAEDKKERLHLKIGRLLLHSQNGSDSRIFDIVSHLNNAKGLMSSSAEKLELATLNARAGRKAKKSSAFEPAYEYYSAAVDLLPQNHWLIDYSFTLEIYNEAAEMAYLSVKEEKVEEYVSEILKNAKGPLDTVHSYLVRVGFYGSQGNHNQALIVGFEILEKLGIKLPKSPNKLNVLGGLISMKLLLRGKSADDIFNLPEMTDENRKAAMLILSNITGSSYITNTNLFVLIVFKMITLSVRYGKNRYSAFGFAVLGMVLAGLADYHSVKKYSELSRRLLQHYPEDEQYGKINYCLLSLHFFHHPMRQSQQLMYQNIQKAFDSGDFLYGSYSVMYYLAYKTYAGYPIAPLIEELEPLNDKLAALKQKIGHGWTNTFLQYLDNLRNGNEVSTALNGRFFNEEKMLPEMTALKNMSGITLMYVLKGTSAYTAGHYKESVGAFKHAAKTLESMLGTPMVSAYHFYRGLAHAAQLKQPSMGERLQTIRILRSSIKFYEKLALHCPENNIARLELLKGALAHITSRSSLAREHLSSAITHALVNHQMHENAIAHEWLAKISIESGAQPAFVEHMDEARFIYHQWGARAKANQLKAAYKLSPLDAGPLETTINQSVDQTTHSTEWLDLQTVIKASQALSSEVQLEGLFIRMINIVMENAGATACAILLKQNGQWFQRISNRIKGADRVLHLETHSLATTHGDLDIPISVANYIIRSGKTLAVDHPQNNPSFGNDPYFNRYNPLSLLCLPFSSKGGEMGILYLENDLIANAFSSDRVELLSILSSQLAISVENALLYENLEEKVAERTAELVQINKEVEHERKKSDSLLLNILPHEIALELKEQGFAKARNYENASVMFADIQGFTEIASKLGADEVVEMLHSYFSKFDEIVTEYRLEKIKTIGDAYMAVGGIPKPSEDAAADTVKAAIQLQRFIAQKKIERLAHNKPAFEMRVGIHTGPIVAGIVGVKKFQYDIWGDTVNTASRMESSGEVGKVNISQGTYELVKHSPQLRFESRGKIAVKGKGEVEMYFVEMSS